MSSICNQLPTAIVVFVHIQSIKVRNSSKNGMARNLEQYIETIYHMVKYE